MESTPAVARRNWPDDTKARIVEEALAPDVNVSAVARRLGISPSQLFGWRRKAMAKGQVMETTIAIDDGRKRAMGRKVISAMGGEVRSKMIGILGLTFKPNTDDMRDAPSIAIIQSFKDAGATIRAYDPEGMDAAKAMITGVGFAKDAYDLVQGAHCLVLVTEWPAFRSFDLERLKSTMATPNLVDLRKVYRRKEVEAHGFSYTGVGKSFSRGAGHSARAAE